MTIYERLKLLNNLTDSEKKLVAYLLQNPAEFISSSAKQITAACYVSAATIYRLCEKIGVSGLAEMKVRLSGDLEEYLSCNTGFDFNYPIQARENQDAIARNLHEIYQETIQQTHSLMDMHEVQKAVSALAQANRITIYTSAGNVYFADNFRFQMQEIGREVYVPTDDYEVRLAAANSTKEDLGIIISFGGRGTLTLMTAEILKANQTRILLITSPEPNPLDPYADIRLLICAKEDHANKISSFSTRLSILYLLDNLYAGLFSLDYEANVAKKQKNYQKLTAGTIAGLSRMQNSRKK